MFDKRILTGDTRILTSDHMFHRMRQLSRTFFEGVLPRCARVD